MQNNGNPFWELSMLEWNVTNRNIAALRFGGVDLIKPWGIEMADSWSFFSMEGNGYRHRIENETIEANPHKVRCYLEIKMTEGHLRLFTEDSIESENSVRRFAKLECLADSYLMDFVLRYRFRKELFRAVRIGSHTHEHLNENVYHQYADSTAHLIGDNLNASVVCTKSLVPAGMAPYIYARDAADEWVVHHRMLPTRSDKEIIKLCSRYFKTMPLPQKLSQALLAITPIRARLWYHNERQPYKSLAGRFFNPNAFPLALLHRTQTLTWESTLTLRPANEN
jgi:hypothetical protein